MQPINRYAASAPTRPAPACLTRRALVGAAALVGLGGCAASLDAGAGSASDGVDPNRTVTIAMSPESEPAAGFDPLVSWGCGEHVHEPLIQSTLVVTDDAMNVTGDLATEFLCSDDGLVWTFTIRDDAVFSDGEPCTAEDVAFTIDRVAHGDTSQADLSMVDAAVALNDRTVELRLSRPHNALLYTLAVLGIVPAHAYGDGYGSAPIGSGRYLLERWDRGQQVVLAANPSYYGAAPAMERVVVVFMEEDAALAAVRAGEVDLAYTSPVRASEDVVGYELVAYGTVDSRGISLPTGPAGGTKVDDGGVAYDAGNAVTSDVAVRRAMVTGVDRAALIDEVLNGYGTVAYSVGDGMPWSSDDMRVECDAGAARRMLEEAGWLLGSDGVRARDGLRASIDLWYTAGDSARQAIAHAFADQMSELGIEVCLRGASWDEIYLHQYASPVLWGWGSNAPIEVYELHHSKGWGNYACYESDVVDAWLDAALAQPELTDSYDLWKRAMWDGTEGVAPQGAATWCWLANVDHLYWKREGLDVAEQKPHPHGHGWSVVNNVDRWSWA